MVPSARNGSSSRWRSARISPAALAVVLLLLNACGAVRPRGPESSAELLSPLPSRSADCLVEPYPEALPGADAVVDSVMLVAAVRELSDQDPEPTGYVLLTLAFDGGGINTRRDVIEHSTRPLVADSIQRLVFAARRQVEESEREWGVRFRVDLDGPVALRVGRREFCPPVARDPQIQAAMQEFNPVGVRYRRGVRERVVHMRALVDSAGLITSAHIARGDLRGSSLEREIAQHLRQFLFTPATLDGVPTSGWVTIPVRIRA